MPIFPPANQNQPTNPLEGVGFDGLKAALQLKLDEKAYLALNHGFAMKPGMISKAGLPPVPKKH